MRLTLGEFIKHQYKVKDLAFGQLTEQFIHDYQTFAMENKGYAIEMCIRDRYETDKSLVCIFDENGTLLFGFFE